MQPLLNVGPSRIIELLRVYQRASNGKDIDDIVCAAGNLIVDCVRQECGDKRDAERYFDAVIGQLKAGLMNHYTAYGRIIDVKAYPSVPPVPLKGLLNE